MKFISALAFLLHGTAAFCQQQFTVEGFSKDYYGVIELINPDEVFSPGSVTVYEQKTNRQIIRVEADELAWTLHDGKVLANIKEMPYGEQSLIIYEDFNFDGKKDFALCDGQHSCYHGPSFQIYLAADNGFTLNKDFTQLAQEYCGMFEVDAEEKKLRTMTKSGCCWHQFSEFAVEQTKPRVVKIITEEEDYPFLVSTEEMLNGKTMVKKEIRKMELHPDEMVFSFSLSGKNKQLVVYQLSERTLHYALINLKDSTVEFFYPPNVEYRRLDFQFTTTAGEQKLSFKNGTAKYTIYERAAQTGIIIEIGGKIYDWTGDVKTKQGKLNKLKELKLENVE